MIYALVQSRGPDSHAGRVWPVTLALVYQQKEDLPHTSHCLAGLLQALFAFWTGKDSLLLALAANFSLVRI